MLAEDYEFLKSRGKKLFVQLQDTTFNVHLNAAPAYFLSKEYGEAQFIRRMTTASRKAERPSAGIHWCVTGSPACWPRWGVNSTARLGGQPSETAIGVTSKDDPNFSGVTYLESAKPNMLAMKNAFKLSVTMQYANFMPGEWLPWEDKGYLRSLYQYGEKICVGLGGPDLMLTKKAQLHHALALIHEGRFSVLIGIAVQDGNYIGETETDRVVSRRKNLVPELHGFAKDSWRVSYIFWANQEPYFTQDVLSSFPA